MLNCSTSTPKTAILNTAAVMRGDRWGPEGPPPEAYSRVTNPERFAPLHNTAAQLLDKLERDFDVKRAEGDDLDSELEGRYPLARPSVTLVPRDPEAAPVVISFSTFPGVYVRVGRWYTAAFPSCGCDACDETAEEEIERLERLMENVTAGHFQEAIRISDSGEAWRETYLGPGAPGSVEKSVLDRNEAEQLILAQDRPTYDWAPWRRRESNSLPSDPF